ncbi:MAG: DNA polymerase III subunit alpha [Rhizobiales bacterium]|nr:DNA polymerase III subunit alpha [Hyphomicrobiales bacterium]
MKSKADPHYVEFATASNFSFLRGASHPEELMVQAAHVGLAGLGLCDRNSVAGVVRAHLVKREQKLALRYHPGARLVFSDGTPDILAYPRDRPAWGRLCRLLTRGNLRAEKGDCILFVEDLLEFAEGLELVVMERCTREVSRSVIPGSAMPDPCRAEVRTGGGYGFRARAFGAPRNDKLHRFVSAAPGRVRLATNMLYGGNDRARLAKRAVLARAAGVPLIAVNDVLYHHPDRRPLQDVLTCIREHVTIDRAGRKLSVNAERYLKAPDEMARLFQDAPEAIEETIKLSHALTFSLDELKYEYPDETQAGFATPQEALVHFTWEGAIQRYPYGIPEAVRQRLEHELTFIAQLRYAPYFLTVYDVVRYARSQDILCQGRGSAANSTVCFCLGITEVNPERVDLLFERFISPDRSEPPDIDIDFEHERREEVIQYVYKKYTRERTGIAATVISYRGRSAIREVGKAFGLSEDTIGTLSSSIWGMGGGSVREADLMRIGIDVNSPRICKMRDLVQEIQSFPRHLSQHVGGFVITRSRLDEVMPIANAAMDDRTFVEWDKDDLDALGILKVDLLGLGMLTCIRKAFELVEKHYGSSPPTPSPHPLRGRLASEARREGGKPKRCLELSDIPSEDPAVYRMLCRADSIGVFQVESRAQMSMLPRLKPKKFYDLVIEVAIVRPGPIQGNMVHPYLRRRLGQEDVDYVRPELEAVLSKTLGVPLFQEQAMRIAIVAGGFTPGEADKLRRAMATFKRTGTIGTFRDKMVKGMLERGYPRDFAERCFGQIEGFGEYGFPESHAASFALLVYASAWLKCRYPDVFAAALLNAQPMGFYAPAQIVRDVRDHGVEVRPVDVNFSDYDATLEEGPRAAEHLHERHREMRGDIRTTHAMRLGLREVKGLSEEDAQSIVKMRGGGYLSVRDVWLRTGLLPRVIERLADADAFGSIGLTRREALWAAKALGRVGDKDDDLPLFRAALSSPPPLRGRSITAGSPAVIGRGVSHNLHPPSLKGGGSAPVQVEREKREPHVHLPSMSLGEEVVNDYRFLKLSLRAHPASFLRPDLARRGIVANDELRRRKSGARLIVSGLVTCRQRPGSAQGVVFMTIEDETALANIIVWPKTFERFRPIVLGARYIAASGLMQEESGVIHVVADRLDDLTPLLARLAQDGTDLESLARCDEVKRPAQDHREKGARTSQQRRLASLLAEMPELISDLDVPARGSAHAPGRRGR